MLLLLSLLACDDPELQSQLDALQAQVDAQAETIEDLQTRLASTEETVQAHDGDISSLQTTDGLHDQDLTGLRTDVDLNIDELASLGDDLDALDSRVAATEGGLSSAQVVITAVEPLTDYLSVDTSADTVSIVGANLYVQSGSGSTNGTVNGLGNLVIGYDEGSSSNKTGSHNLILGFASTYTSYGGIVAGDANTITGRFSSVLGGSYNTASGEKAVVLGGESCEASGENSTIYGGFGFEATSTDSYAP